MSGDDIPILGRLMTIADVYDALICRRVYKSGMPHEKAVEIITESKGSHFDPDIVEAFMEIADEFTQIAKRYEDTEHDVHLKAKQMGCGL